MTNSWRWLSVGAVLAILAAGVAFFAWPRHHTTNPLDQARVLMARGELLEAGRRLKTMPPSDERYLAEAELALLAADLNQAHRHIGKVSDEGQKSRNARLLAARILHALGDWDTADGWLRQLEIENPADIDVIRWRAVVAVDGDNRALAKQMTERLAQLDPNDAKPHRMLAILARRAGAPQAAWAHYQDALQRDPANVSIRQEAADLAIEINLFDDAAGLLDDAPEVPGVLTLRGVHARAKGDDATAVKFLESALLAQPRNFRALLELGRIRAVNGEFAEALRLLRRAEEIDDQHWPLQEELALTQERLGNTEAAGKHRESAQRIREALRVAGEAKEQKGDATP